MKRFSTPAAALCATLLAMGLTAPAAWAQSSVTAYGQIDAAAGRYETAGTEKAGKVEGGGLSTSFLGFKGEEDLGGTVKAVFALEHYLRPDTGSAGRANGDAFWSRSSYVGLKGEFGSTVLGRNTTPLYQAAQGFNAFGDSDNFSPVMRQLFTPSTGHPFLGDNAWSNSLVYSSAPNERGLAIQLIGAFGEGAANSTGRNIGASISYAKEALGIAIAYQRVKSPGANAPALPAGFDRQETLLIGTSYAIGIVKLYGQYAHVGTQATADLRSNLYGLGASVQLGNGQLIAQYGHTQADAGAGANDITHKTFSAGYDYAFSKRTDAYALWMNDRQTELSNGNSVAAGLRVRF